MIDLTGVMLEKASESDDGEVRELMRWAADEITRTRAALAEAHGLLRRYRNEIALESAREMVAQPSALVQAMTRACSELPEGSSIVIELENGAGSVYLHTSDGHSVLMEVDAEDRLTAEISAAIDAALVAKGE